MPKYFDAHTHHIPEVPREDVFHCVNSVIENDWESIIRASRTRTDIIPFIGIHPWHVASATPGWVDRLRNGVLTLKESGPVGIGECGLDRSRDCFELQRDVCRTHLEIAVETRIPLSIHCVRAWSDLLELFKKVNIKRSPILLHSFSANEEIAVQLQKWNVFFSLKIARSAEDALKENRSNASLKALKAVRAYLPKDRLLLESDTKSDEHTRDQKIETIYAEAAPLLGMTVNECIQLMQDNFSRYLSYLS